MSLDCIPCFVRQTLDASRLVTDDTVEHERILRDILNWLQNVDLQQSPPELAQRIHRKLREIAKIKDPYAGVKQRHNQMALDLLPALRKEVLAAPNPLEFAARIAIAGNVIDMGMKSMIEEDDVHTSLHHALTEPFIGDWALFHEEANKAKNILYLADNAGEIAFDKLLIEQLGPERVTVAVRGAPILNDATMEDAHAVGMHELVPLIENGSDAPGTLLSDCNETLNSHFSGADMIIAKGQGNFESLSHQGHDVFFLFKVKCPVIAKHVDLPLGTQVLNQFR